MTQVIKNWKYDRLSKYHSFIFRRLKQACANHLKRDQNGLVMNVKEPDREFVRNAQVEVITNSENLQFAIR